MSDLKHAVKEMIIQRLKLEGMTPDQIDDQAPLFGDGLGLDSIDALELVLGIEQTFGVKIEDEAAGMKAFRNVESLAAYIAEHKPTA
ncbi:MAG: Acyl carrier protein [Acidobacteria bacterium ADurb.Bin340]|nr:MAG: Acyl carrier protein [Acidobacteria bacterium ADurb.Bin340]HOD31928.1 phosphopantetheine-binding protein [Holophaga sp.]HQL49314.1 phosphopantetheine-binding protein [Holophaga sp.]